MKLTNYVFIMSILMIAITGTLVFFSATLITDTNTIQQYSLRVNELNADVHIAILNSEKGLDFDLWTVNSMRKTLEDFSAFNNLETWYLIDPGKEIMEKSKMLNRVVLQFYNFVIEPTKNDIITSYTKIRPSFTQAMTSFDLAVENAINLGQKTTFGMLMSILITVILLYFLIFFPLIREIENYNLKRTASLIFKEFREKMPKWSKNKK